MKPFTRIGAIVFVLTLTILSACAQSRSSTGSITSSSTSSTTNSGQSVYSDVIQPIFSAKCSSCHGGSSLEAGLSLESWEQVMAGSRRGEAVIAFDAENSLLVELATKYQAGSHPEELSSASLSDAEIQQIKDWINSGAPGPDEQIPFVESNDLVYVTNQGEGTVNVIDTKSNTVVRRVDLRALGFAVMSKPHHIAVEEDGSYWYVSMIAENRVLKFSRDNELVGQAEFQAPGLMALDSKSDLLFVGRSMAAVNPPQSVGFIERSTMDIEEVEVFHPRPHAIAVSSTGEYVFSGSLGENRIIAINVESGDGTRHTVDGPIHTLVQFGVTPDGQTMIVGGQLTSKLFFYDISRAPELTLLKTIDVNAAPWHPVFSPDGKFAYLANKMANTVTVIDMESQSIARVIEGEGFSQPHGAALSGDGKFLYVSNNNLNGHYTPRYNLGDNKLAGTVVVIDTETFEIVKVLEVGVYPSGAGSRRAL